MMKKTESQLIGEAEDLLFRHLREVTNAGEVVNAMLDFSAQHTQSLTEEIKELKAENERLREWLLSIKHFSTQIGSNYIPEMVEQALTQNKEER